MLKHMTIAQTQLGQREIEGAENNSQIVEYFTSTSYHATDDAVPWCAAFVNWVLMRSDIARTKSAAALSFLDWGIPVKLKDVKYGDIAVIDSGHGRGHVGFVVGFNDQKEVGLLGGNQNNEVNVSWFKVQDIREFRRAKTMSNSKTVVAATGATAAIAGAAGYTMSQAQRVSEAAVKAAQDAVAAADSISTSVPQVLIQTDEIRSVVQILPDNWQLPAIWGFGLLNVVFIIWERYRKMKEFNN